MTESEMTRLIAEAVAEAVRPVAEQIEAAGIRLIAAQAKLNDLRIAAAASERTLSSVEMALLEGAGYAPGGALRHLN